MKKTILIFITWTILSAGLGIFQSCCNVDPVNYRLISINGEVEKITGTEFRDGSPAEFYITEPYHLSIDGIAYDSLGLHIYNDVETFSFNLDGAVFSQSFACSPDKNYEVLTDLLITSNQDYNNSFPSGTDLTELVSIRKSSLINSYRVEGEPTQTFLTNDHLGLENYFITFKTPPNENKVHDLTIKYILEDGREYTTIIQGLKINK